MSASPPLDWLRLAIPNDSGIDRKALAGLLLEIAQDLKPELRAEQSGLSASDLRLQQLRTLLLGAEIEILSRLQGVLEDPEKLATAVGRVLPTAIAEASSDARLGQVLAPAMEKATESSIRQNPRTLVDILYPLIVPTIGKSIRETIAATFQSLNQTLKYSLSWRGLLWRWEAWRSGASFAEVVLRHTLVYQVEHVFLIHRHTGLLISHVAAEDAASQDPQLISSMLVAIQDFVRDSFTGAEHQGLDAVRLGDLRLWSEPGPFATLVAVIRGDPPEAFSETLRDALSRIHAERHHALESFDGDSAGFSDVEAQLRECLAQQQASQPKPAKFGRIVVLAWLVVIVLLVGAFVVRWWESDRLWQTYVEQLRAQPGIVIAELGKRDGKFVISGLRDPLAIDPQFLLRQTGINSDDVISRWAPYEAMQPQFVIERLRHSLQPPPSVTLAIEGDRTVAQGSAPSDWLDRARIAARTLPAGAPAFDLSGVHNTDEAGTRLWDNYIAQLRVEPGIVITATGRRDDKFFVTGLRDPLASDPADILQRSGIDPGKVAAQWSPYQSLDPRLVLKRLQVSLEPPTSVTLAIDGGRIVAKGSASSSWLENARLSARLLPPGAPTFDLSGVKDADEASLQRWDLYISRLQAEPGIVVTEQSRHDDKFFVAGLRDPLATDPQSLLKEVGIDPARVVGRWAPYEALNPQFVLRRLQASLDLPPTVTLAVDGDRIVAQGSASPRWLERARLAGRMLPTGGPALDLSGVSNLFEGAIGKIRDRIEARIIHFEEGASLPAPGQDAILDQQAEDIKQAASLSAAMGVTTRVTLNGHADSAGQGTANLSLSAARAEAVRALLKKRGVNPDLLAVRGAGALEPLQEETSDAARLANRRVSFSLGIDE